MSTLDAHEDLVVSSSDESEGETESKLVQFKCSRRQELQEAQFQSLYVLKSKTLSFVHI